jgi:O-antigen ligase
MMKNLRRLLWIVALFPWFDLVIRQTLPSIVASTWDEVLLLAILALLVINFREDRRYTLIPKSVVWPFAVFIFCSAASVVIHVVPLAVSIDAVRVIFQPMLFALLTMYLMDDENTRQTFLQILIVSTVLIAAFGIVQYALKLDLGLWQHSKDTGQFRITSIFSNPNALGSYFNMVLAFTVPGVLFVKNMKHKLAFAAVSGIIFVALLLTFSRSAWIAFMAMVLYVVFVWNKKWLLALPVLAAATPFVMPASVIARFGNLLDPTYYQMSAEYGRLAFWAAAIEKISENPLFGVGLGTFGDSVPLRHNIPFATWVDNHYLKLGAEIGIPGILAFLVLLLALFLLAHRLFRNAVSENQRLYALGIAGVIITMTVQNVTASILESLAAAIFFYSFIGVLFALLYQYRREGVGLKEGASSAHLNEADLSVPEEASSVAEELAPLKKGSPEQ